MPRKTAKIKPGAAGMIHISFLIDAETAREVDEAAAQMKQGDKYKRSFTRTDALRVLIRDALDARKSK
jgi:hypothetical protein